MKQTKTIGGYSMKKTGYKTKVLLTVDSEAEDSQIQDAEMNNAQNSQQNAVSENTIKSSV